MASVSNTKGTKQDSRVQVPLGFLETLGGTIGQRFSVNELIRSLPTTQSLFGGGPVGLLPANQYGPPAQAGTGTSAVQGTANAGTFTPRQLMTVASGLGGPEKSKTQALINDAISSGRLSWDQNLSTSDLNNLLSSPGSGIDNPRRSAGMLVSMEAEVATCMVRAELQMARRVRTMEGEEPGVIPIRPIQFREEREPKVS